MMAEPTSNRIMSCLSRCALMFFHVGVKVIIDSKALLSIIGSEIDYVEDQLASQFVFINPNVKETCGCGESFMT